MPPTKNVSKETLRELYINRKMTMQDICNELKISNPGTVSKYLRKYDIQIRDTNYENSLLYRLKVSEEELKNMFNQDYNVDKTSTNQMARKYNVSQVIISRYFKKFGFKIRSKGFHSEGCKNNKWNGGVINTAHGYIAVYCPNHPYPIRGKYVYEHRLVVEKSIGRYLTKDEHIHHKNEIKNDNRLENLQVMSSSDHHKLHGEMRRYKKQQLIKGQIDGRYREQIELDFDVYL